jgi:predicted XRE-type DNA-binding protein
MNTLRFSSVWDAIEDSPMQAESMKLRSALMTGLRDSLVSTGASQSEAARLLGVTQPRISDLMRGRIEAFSLDRLVSMTAAACLKLRIQIRSPHERERYAGLLSRVSLRSPGLQFEAT